MNIHILCHTNGGFQSEPTLQLIIYNLGMPNYRRRLVQGGIFFFTVVTCMREPIFASADARAVLHSAWTKVAIKRPFELVAICLLPDHIHCIWSLPEGDANYSLRWREIKRYFSLGYSNEIGPGRVQNPSQEKHHEAGIWQRRFWEHTVRDEQDFNNHLDYIHYNPVKHGLVTRFQDWPWSSFHRYVRSGYYEKDWGEGNEKVHSQKLFIADWE